CDRAVAVLPGAAQDPVVDREAAARPRGGEDAEARDDALRRGRGAELRAAVHPGRVPDGQDVAEVRDHLAGEAGGEPDRVEPAELVADAVVAGEVAEPERGRDGERRRAEDDRDRPPL